MISHAKITKTKNYNIKRAPHYPIVWFFIQFYNNVKNTENPFNYANL